MGVVEKEAIQVHVRYNGESYDFTGEQLDIGDLSDDNAIKSAVANQLQVNIAVFNTYTIDKSDAQNIVVRPEAEFG